VSATGSDRRGGGRAVEPLGDAEGLRGALCLEVVFRDLDTRGAHAVADAMIARAHELANHPDHECDVDVGVRRVC
jgi:hypothetical protein